MNISPETERLQNALAELASAIVKIINDRVDQAMSGTVPARLPAQIGLAESKADNQMVGKEEIAKMLGITIRTVDNWKDRGLLPYFKIGRSVRFRKNDVVQHLNQSTRVCRR
jgi:excisionase family DNA binding protein